MAYSGKKISIVTGFLLRYISENNLTKDQKLPTENEMLKATGVSRVTLRRALSNLQDEHYIFSVQGSGYFVGENAFKANEFTVPIIISYNQENSQILNIVNGAQRYLKNRMCGFEVHVTQRDMTAEKEILTRLYNGGCRCAILFPVSSDGNNDLYFHLIQNGMNIVFIDRRPKTITCCNSVISDNMTGGYLATKHLIDLGHRNIAMFGFDYPEHESSISERHLGYIHALKEYNIPVPDKTFYHSFYNRENDDVRHILSPSSKITAVFAASDYAAVDIATHAYNHGIRIPEDLSVIGFDNLNVTTMFTPHLSTIDQSFTKLGEEAAEIAYNSISGKTDRYIQKTIPVKLIARDSTAKPKKRDV